MHVRGRSISGNFFVERFDTYICMSRRRTVDPRLPRNCCGRLLAPEATRDPSAFAGLPAVETQYTVGRALRDDSNAVPARLENDLAVREDGHEILGTVPMPAHRVLRSALERIHDREQPSVRVELHLAPMRERVAQDAITVMFADEALLQRSA